MIDLSADVLMDRCILASSHAQVSFQAARSHPRMDECSFFLDSVVESTLAMAA